MELLPEVQEGVLALLCFDDEYAAIAEQLVPVDTFDPFFKEVAQAASRHRARYKQAPGDHTLDLIRTLSARDPESAETFETIYQLISDLRVTVQPKYVLERASYFSRWQTLRQAAGEILGALDQQSEKGVDDAETALSQAGVVTARHFDGGHSMADVTANLEILNRAEVMMIPTGIEALDAVRCAPTRGRLHTLLAATGAGKSWYLCHLTKQAARRGYRTLYVTLEMDELEVAQRLYQAMFSIAENESIGMARRLQRNQDGVYEGISQFDFPDGPRPTLKDFDAATVLQTKLEKARNTGRRIVVKEFPQNQLTVDGLEAYIDNLALHTGFYPDLVCVDYPDLFDKNPADLRGSIRLIHEGLKGLAQRRNIAVASVSQTNRGGVNAKVIKLDDVSEDYSKMMTADHVVTLNQTDEEEAIGFARLYVAKNRTGKARKTVGITQSIAIGQFCLSSAEYDSRMDEDIMTQESRAKRGDLEEGTDYYPEEIEL